MNRKNKFYRGEKCLNCETSLDISEAYCHRCGQINSVKKTSVSDFVESFFENFYAYDSKLKNTFSNLFTRPAFVAKEIIKGKIHSYANPFRLFLSVIVIYFLISNTFNFREENKIFNIKSGNESSILKDSIINEKITFNETELNKSWFLERFYKKIDLFIIHIESNPAQNSTEAFESLKIPNTTENNFLFKKAWLLVDFDENIIDSEIVKEIKTKSALIIFMLLPFVALAFLFAFNRKNITYTDNLIFVYTIATVGYFVAFINFIIFQIFNLKITLVTDLILFFYYYKSFRNFYEFSRWKTLFRSIILVILSFVFGITMLFLMIILIYLAM